MLKSIGLLALATLLAAAPAAAAEIKTEGVFAWSSTGTTYTLGDGHPYFVGAFSGINILNEDAGVLNNSAIECPGFNDIGVGAGGYCTVTASNGDKLFLKWSCDAVAPAAGDLIACDGKTIVTGGTGKFEKATGGNDLSSHIRGISATGTAMGYTTLTNYVVTY